MTTGFETLEKQIAQLEAKPLNLNLTRGLPAQNQIDLVKTLRSIEIPDLEVVFEDGSTRFMSKEEANRESGIKSKSDIYNYGVPTGLISAKQLMAPLLKLPPEQVFVGGPSSLFLAGHVFEVFTHRGTFEGDTPWKEVKGKWLCPVAGYDRHHDRLELMGIEMIPVPMTETGPDMDIVEKLVAEDETILGMWAIPTFSNPTGDTYSDEVVNRLCSMKTAYKGFRIFVDDAYCVHGIDFPLPQTKSFVQAAKEAGNPDRAIVFISTSKISIPGAGLSAFGTSLDNIKFIQAGISLMGIAIGDKITQAQHVSFYKNTENLIEHMKALADIIKPKRDITLKVMEEELGLDGEFATWTSPSGGYFISVYTKAPIAKEVVALSKKLGVALTGAGAAFPYKKDPNNNHLRISFTYPPEEDVKKAMEVVCTVIKYLTLKQN